MKAFQLVAALAVLTAPLAAPACAQIGASEMAQAEPMSSELAASDSMPTEIVTPDAFVTALQGARIRMFYDGIGQDFLFELQDRDVADLFSYGFPPPDRSIGQSDIVVVVREDWPALVTAWDSVGIPAITGSIRPYAMVAAGAPHVSVTSVTAPGGHTIRVYNFVRTAEGEVQSERCMARQVINDTYAGLDESRFNSFECSRALR
ncbi:hypothetical protein ACWCOP_11055 [Maricaulaceae bacterium MS644]